MKMFWIIMNFIFLIFYQNFSQRIVHYHHEFSFLIDKCHPISLHAGYIEKKYCHKLQIKM